MVSIVSNAKMEYKRAVITGGAGFIGSNLAEDLAKKSKVILIDNFSTGRMDNIEELVKKENVKLIEGSITDLHLLQRAFRGIDYVFHQAAIPGVTQSITDPLTSNEVNIRGTLNVLIAARDNKVRKVVYASSSSVYGDTAILSQREDMLPQPMSPYAVSKLAGEYYCHIFTIAYGLPTVCLRYFNVYGLRQNPNSEYAAVIPIFTKNVLEGKTPIIFGDGRQTRDFVFVKDVTEANILAAESQATGAFNIGSGSRATVNELAKLILNLLGKNLEPIHWPPRPGDIRHSLADISKAKTFGYNPRYNLAEGLKETIRHFSRGNKLVS